MDVPLPPHQLFRQLAYIGGKWCASSTHRVLEVINPANGSALGTIPQLNELEVSRAIIMADQAGSAWRLKSPSQRCEILRRWFELCIQNKNELALLLTLEQGKPLHEAKGEIEYGSSYIEWYAEEGKRAHGEILCHPSTDKRILTIRQAVGVVCAITPWNFPNAMVTRKLAPALAVGCTVVLKPASQTPYSALALALLGEQAGIPAGVFNVVTGLSSEIGPILTQHEYVRKLSFTGSTEVGVQLQAQSAKRMLRTSMELGGNAPFIVFEDADLDRAVEGLMVAKFRNAGQTCVCANRIYVHAQVHDIFLKKLLVRMQSLQVGAGWEEGVSIGPLFNEYALRKVEAHFKSAMADGALCQIGGQRRGRYYEPTVLTGVRHNSIFLREETFGPLAPIISFEEEQQVLTWANDVPVGLAAYFYTQNHARVWRMTEGLEVGMVGVNEGLISTAVAPFGGIKMSGLGREGAAQGLSEYMNTKYCCYGL